MVSESRDRWFFAGRYYATTRKRRSDTGGLGLELEDVGLAPGRGRVLEAFQHDTTGLFTFTAFVADPLPFPLVEQFVVEARRRLADGGDQRHHLGVSSVGNDHDSGRSGCLQEVGSRLFMRRSAYAVATSR